MSEHPVSLHLIQLHFIFLQTNLGGAQVFQVIRSFKAFGSPDIRRNAGAGGASPRCVRFMVFVIMSLFRMQE